MSENEKQGQGNEVPPASTGGSEPATPAEPTTQSEPQIPPNRVLKEAGDPLRKDTYRKKD